MPRTLVRARGHSRKRSLGWLAVAWMEFFCVHGPGDVQGMPVSHGDEYTGFVVDCYALDRRGKLLYDSAFLSRPKGCDKSGLGARLALFEAFGPCRFAGWAKGGEVYEDPWGLGFEYVYEPGEPMGRPVTVPYVRIMATEEGQTGNVYDTIHYNLDPNNYDEDEDHPGARLSQVPGVNNGLTRVVLPDGGEIMPSTASSASKDGGKETFVVFDESHLYNTPELRRMYRTVTRNMRKRKKIAGTWFLETTTMFAPGEESVAESTFQLAEQIQAAQQQSAAGAKARQERLLYDHRWGECEDLSAEDQLRTAILEAFGEAIEWNDIDGIVAEFYDTRNPPQESRRYFLNAPTETWDAWLAQHEWAACARPGIVVADGELITLGFDGSRRRERGRPDATALIGCRLSDGHVFELAVWEAPAGPDGDGWQVPTVEVDAAVRAAFERYTVVGFYADPAKWETWIAQWEADFGGQLQVKATRDHPIEWWMTGGRAGLTSKALEKFHSAVVEQELTHDGAFNLTRHALNARRRVRNNTVQIAKEHPDSLRKIDAVVAAVLAYQARLDAVAKGVTDPGVQTYAARRIR